MSDSDQQILPTTPPADPEERFWEMLREGLDHIQTNAEHWPGEDYYTLEQVAEAKERLTFIEDLYAVACQTFGADWMEQIRQRHGTGS